MLAKIFDKYNIMSKWHRVSKLQLEMTHQKIINTSSAVQKALGQGQAALELAPWEKEDLQKKESLIKNMKKISKGLHRNISALNDDSDGLFKSFTQDRAGTLDVVNDLIEERSAANKVDKKIRVLLNDFSKKNKLFSDEFVPQKMVFKYMHQFSNRMGQSKQKGIASELLKTVFNGKSGLETSRNGSNHFKPKVSNEKYISAILLKRPDFAASLRSRERPHASNTSRSIVNCNLNIINIQSMSTDQSSDHFTTTKNRLYTITKRHGFSPSPQGRSTSPRLVRKLKLK